MLHRAITKICPREIGLEEVRPQSLVPAYSSLPDSCGLSTNAPQKYYREKHDALAKDAAVNDTEINGIESRKEFETKLKQSKGGTIRVMQVSSSLLWSFNPHMAGADMYHALCSVERPCPRPR